jgi:hypothetical protein
VSEKNISPYIKNISFQIRRRGLKLTKVLILIICKSERDHNLLCLVIHTSSFTTTGISGIASSFNAGLVLQDIQAQTVLLDPYYTGSL